MCACEQGEACEQTLLGWTAKALITNKAPAHTKTSPPSPLIYGGRTTCRWIATSSPISVREVCTGPVAADAARSLPSSTLTLPWLLCTYLTKQAPPLRHPALSSASTLLA